MGVNYSRRRKIGHGIAAGIAMAIVFGSTPGARAAAEAESGFFAPAPDDQLHLKTSFGLWALSMHGTTGVRNLDSEVNVNFDEIFDHLDFGVFPGVELTKDNWLLEIDGAFAKLSANKSFSPTRGIDFNANLGILDAAVGYTILRMDIVEMPLTVTPLIGARVTYLGIELEPANFNSVEDSRTWMDPFVGGKTVLGLTRSLDWRTQGFYGGFDIGSRRVWSVATYLDWHFSEKCSFNVGYRADAWDYDLGNFTWDITFQGPWIGLTVAWF